jgi:hypothetical protein
MIVVVNAHQQLSLPTMHRKLRIFTKKVKHKSEEAALVIKISFIIYATNF